MRKFLSLALWLALPLTVVAQDTEPKPVSTRAGAFTVEQAVRGGELFETVCGECHQPADFQDGFLEGWTGQTVDALFKEIRATMPEDSPGSLKSSEYAAIIAYLFQLNGLPAGSEPLPGSLRRLKEVLVEAPAPPEECGG